MTKLKVGDLVRFKTEFSDAQWAARSSVPPIGIVVGFIDRDDPAVEYLDVVCSNGVKRRTWDYLVEKVCND